MKKILSITTLLLITANINAQEVGDSFPRLQRIFNGHFEIMKSDNKIEFEKDQLISPLVLKIGQKYDKIQFKRYPDKLWFSGEVESVGFRVKFKNTSALRYISNNQLYSEEKVEGSVKTYYIYHSNGRVAKRLDEYPNSIINVRWFDENGLLISNLSRKHLVQNAPHNRGTVSPVPLSPAPNFEPNYYVDEFDNAYFGYQYIGTMFTKDQLEITGCFTTLQSDRGNGGVFFIENTANNKCSWVTVLNHKIIATQPALKSEKPDIHQINQNIVGSAYDWEIKKLESSEKKRLSGNYRFKTMRTTLNMIDVKSSSEPVLNGYAFEFTPFTNVIENDALIVKSGVFKDGKLNGQGFVAQLKFSYNVDGNFLKPVNIKWDMEAGSFANNVFIDGRKFATNDYYYRFVDDKLQNIFDKIPFDNFEYIGKLWPLHPSKYRYLHDMKDQKSIYSKALQRSLNVVSIDQAKGTITTETDVPGKTHTFDVKKDPIYVYDYGANSFTETEKCPVKINKPIYKEVKKLLFSTGTSTTNSSTVKGVYYDKKTTTTSSTADKDFYVSKSVIDRYESVVCPKCNGTGISTKKVQEGGRIRIVKI